MLTTVEAQAAILREIADTGVETVASVDAAGRILRQDVAAERDQPPFDRVTMDGIAIRHSDWENGQRSFPIAGTQHAGDTVLDLETGHCVEIMTGASLANGADCIIPVERISVNDGAADIEDGYKPAARQFIHPRGSDHPKDSTLIRQGHTLSAADIAILVSCGLTSVDVSKRPTVHVISTGNELVPAGQAIEPHQIRMSNGPALVSLLAEHGYTDSHHNHLADDPQVMRDRLAQHLDEADVLILSGGVSMGKADFVPQVLQDLGVRVVFHRISQRPGKPMWFGIGPKNQTVFALPGNPVSTLVCCRQYVLPALHKAAAGKPANPEFATLSQDVTFRPRLTCFLPTRIVSNANGQLLALPVATNTSGDFAALTGTDGYIELALEQTEFPATTTVPLHRWKLPAG